MGVNFKKWDRVNVIAKVSGKKYPAVIRDWWCYRDGVIQYEVQLEGIGFPIVVTCTADELEEMK